MVSRSFLSCVQITLMLRRRRRRFCTFFVGDLKLVNLCFFSLLVKQDKSDDGKVAESDLVMVDSVEVKPVSLQVMRCARIGFF